MEEHRIDFEIQNTNIPSLNVQLLYIEHYKRDRKAKGTLHAHKFWQAELVIQGRVNVLLPDQTLVINPMTALLIPPGIRHCFEYEDAASEYYSFKFACDRIESIKSPIIYDEPHGIDPIKHFLVESLNEHDKSSYWTAIHVQNALKTFLELEMVYGKEVQSKSISEQVHDLLSRFQGVFPSAEEISVKIGYCRPHLSKIMKEESGKSLKPFLDEERIKMTKSLIKVSDLSISEIAYQMGFKELSSFSKFFKRMTKSSPSQYLNQVRQQDIDDN